MTVQEKNKILKEVKRCFDNNKAFIICTPDITAVVGTAFTTNCMLKLIHNITDNTLQKIMYKLIEDIDDKRLNDIVYKSTKIILEKYSKNLDQSKDIINSIIKKSKELL